MNTSTGSNAKTNGDGKMKMYHGTTSEGLNGILNSGMINGNVYLTPNFQTACDYAANNSPDYAVIEVFIDESEFCADSEFVKCADGDFVLESLNNGSVYIERDILASEFVSIKKFEDFEPV